MLTEAVPAAGPALRVVALRLLALRPISGTVGTAETPELPDFGFEFSGGPVIAPLRSGILFL